MSEEVTNYDELVEPAERNRLIDDRMRGLASDRFLARMDQALEVQGANERVRALDEQIATLEAMRA